MRLVKASTEGSWVGSAQHENNPKRRRTLDCPLQDQSGMCPRTEGEPCAVCSPTVAFFRESSRFCEVQSSAEGVRRVHG